MSEHYEPTSPTSHGYLYGIPKEQLFQLFLTQMSTLKVDENGVWCRPVEAQGLQRIARAVQARADHSPDGEALHTMATIVRVLVHSYVVGFGEKPPPAGAQQWIAGECGPALGAGIVDRFYQARAKLPDVLPAEPAAVLEVGPDEEWSDEELAALPVCTGCGLPMIPGVSHSRCAAA